jgi:hypothetical protein
MIPDDNIPTTEDQAEAFERATDPCACGGEDTESVVAGVVSDVEGDYLEVEVFGDNITLTGPFRTQFGATVEHLLDGEDITTELDLENAELLIVTLTDAVNFLRSRVHPDLPVETLDPGPGLEPPADGEQTYKIQPAPEAHP